MQSPRAKRRLSYSSNPTTPRKRQKRSSSIPPKIRPMLLAPKNEVKFWDFYGSFDGSSSGTGNAGAVVNLLTLNPIAQGPNYKNNVIGRMITPVSLDLRYFYNGPVTNAGGTGGLVDLYDCLRVIVFQWMNDGVPTLLSILDTQINTSPLNTTNINKINVLSDQLYNFYPTVGFIPSGGQLSQAMNNYSGRRFIKGKKMVPIEMVPTSSTTVAFQEGGIYMLFIGQGVAVPYPRASWAGRLSFTDS